MKKSSFVRIMAVAGVMAVTGLLLVLFQSAAIAAPGRAFQDGEPDLQQVSVAMKAGADWLVTTHQNADGGYSSFSAGADLAPSDAGGTLDAVWALSLAGADTSAPIAYLEANGNQLAEYVGQDGSTAGKALLSLFATGRALNDFAGQDLLSAASEHISATGQFDVNTSYNQSLAIIGSTFAGQPVPPESADWLAGLQATDGDLAGSWDDGFGTAGNPDSTALAMLALRAAGRPAGDPAIQAGMMFLAQAQLESGGWEYGPGLGENANSTAIVVMALTMLGEDLTSPQGGWLKNGVSPLTALLSWQGESGAFQADYGDGRFDDFFSTVQSLAALGFQALAMGREPLQAPAEATPQDLTPTRNPVPFGPSPTPKPPMTTPEATEEPATATPEVIAVEQNVTPAAPDEGESEVTATPAQSEDEGSSVLPWIAGGGASVIALSLGWWAVSRRREA